MAKPVLLVTRRMPPAVEARAAAEFDARLTSSDVPLADVAAQAAGADAILTCPGDTFDAALIAALPASVKVIATFSVGYDHIDVESAAARGIVSCNTPDVLSVATAETALAADTGCLAARRRRRAPDPIGALAGLGSDAVARHRRGRSAARHLRHGPHRP